MFMPASNSAKSDAAGCFFTARTKKGYRVSFLLLSANAQLHLQWIRKHLTVVFPELRRGCVKSKSAGMRQEYTVFCPVFQLVKAVHNLWASGKQAAYWQQLDEELHVGRWIQVIPIWLTPQIWQKVPLGLRQSLRSPVLLPAACVSPNPVILTAADYLCMCGLSRAMSQHNKCGRSDGSISKKNHLKKKKTLSFVCIFLSQNFGPNLVCVANNKHHRHMCKQNAVVRNRILVLILDTIIFLDTEI